MLDFKEVLINLISDRNLQVLLLLEKKLLLSLYYK